MKIADKENLKPEEKASERAVQRRSEAFVVAGCLPPTGGSRLEAKQLLEPPAQGLESLESLSSSEQDPCTANALRMFDEEAASSISRVVTRPRKCSTSRETSTRRPISIYATVYIHISLYGSDSTKRHLAPIHPQMHMYRPIRLRRIRSLSQIYI